MDCNAYNAHLKDNPNVLFNITKQKEISGVIQKLLMERYKHSFFALPNAVLCSVNNKICLTLKVPDTTIDALQHFETG